MNKNLKKYLGILLVLATLIFAGFWFLGDTEDSTLSNLHPEKTISHGHGLVVDVEDSNKLYIATHHGLLVLVNEKELYRIGQSRDDYMGFSVHPTNPRLFFSSGHPSLGGNIGFQRSEDGGVTWKKVSDGLQGPVDFHAVTISPVDPNIVYGWYQGNLQRSLDQGRTWEIVNRDILAISLTADSQNENILYAATPNGRGVMVSEDKGETWKSLSSKLEGGAVAALVVHPQDANTLLVFSEKLGGLGKSVDGGTSWKKNPESFQGETVLHIAFNRIDPMVVYALTHGNTLYKSADSGDTWQKIL